jgi:integrase
VSGACRSLELVKLKIEDIEEIKLGLLVQIPHTKTKKPRSFTIMKGNCLRTYKKYLPLRSKNFNERRFFIKYQDGVCHRQAVGIHKISSVPQEVAKGLNLENVNGYRGHCLRCISATLLVDSSKSCKV